MYNQLNNKQEKCVSKEGCLGGCIIGHHIARAPRCVALPNQRVVSSTFWIALILVQSHFELVSLVLGLEATEPVSEPVTQMAVEPLIISYQYSKKDECKSYKATFFFM